MTVPECPMENKDHPPKSMINGDIYSFPKADNGPPALLHKSINALYNTLPEF